MITGMFKGSQGTIHLGGAEKDLCAEYVHISSDMKELEKRKKAIASQIKQAIIETAKEIITEKKASAVAGQYSVSWSFFNRTTVDSDALKKAGLYGNTQRQQKLTGLRLPKKKEQRDESFGNKILD
jgi:predicted phage-related endonuclease